MRTLALFVAAPVMITFAQIVLNDAEHTEVQGLTPGANDMCIKDAYSGNYLSARSQANGGEAVFNFDPPESGCFVIEEWHPGSEERCSRYLPEKARVDVAYCKGKTAYGYIDQTQGGGRWNILGALPFYQGWQGNITVTNTHPSCREGKDCFWVVDAFRVTKIADVGARCVAPESMPQATENPQPQATPKEEPEVAAEQMTSSTINMEVPAIVIDDTLVLQRRLQGSWKVESITDSQLQCRRQGWKQQFLYLDGFDGKTPVEFPFDPQADGCYLVEEFHPANTCEKDMSPEVSLTISYCKNKSLDVIIDQTTGGNKWNVVALLPFYKGHAGGLKVKHVSGAGIATADAFRFTKVASTCAGARAKLLQYHEVSQQQISVTVDDTSATVTGAHKSVCDEGALHGSAHAADEGEASATFNIVPASTGCYRVDQFHPKATKQCSLGSAGLNVNYCLGQSRYIVAEDMSQQAGQWNSVGHFPFYAGEPGSVVSHRLESSKLWAADGFRFTKVSDSCRQVPETTSVTMRIVGEGLHLIEPQLKEGHLTKQTDMRLAFHDAMVKATGLVEEAVRLLALRNGSIIIEYELVGTDGKAAAAALNAEVGSQLQVDLCAAATVGMEPQPECKLELMSTKHISSPIPFTEDMAVTLDERLVAIGVIVGAIMLLCGIVAGILVGRWCVQRRKAKTLSNATDHELPVVTATELTKVAEVNQEVGDTASTATPPEMVESEVQTEVSGDIATEQTETFSVGGDGEVQRI